MRPGERIVNDVGVGRGIPELLVAQGLVRSPKNTGEKAGGRLIVRNSKLRIAVGFGVAAGGLVSENFAVIANAQGIQKRRRDNPVPGSASVIPGPDGLASGGERSGKKRAAAAWVGGIQKDEAQMVIGAEVLIAFNNVVIEVIGAGSGKKVSVVYQRLRGGLRKHAEDLSGSGSNSIVRNDVSGEGIPALLSVDGLSGPGIEDLSGRNARPGAGIDGSCYRRGEIAREIAITKRVVGQRDHVGGRRALCFEPIGVKKEERSVFPVVDLRDGDGATNGKAVFILAIYRARDVEKAARVKIGILQVFVKVTVVLVGS
jgi:hypothetical protein